MKLVSSDNFISVFSGNPVVQSLRDFRTKFASADFDYTRSFRKLPAG